MVTVFWETYLDYPEQGETVTRYYYAELLQNSRKRIFRII